MSRCFKGLRRLERRDVVSDKQSSLWVPIEGLSIFTMAKEDLLINLMILFPSLCRVSGVLLSEEETNDRFGIVRETVDICCKSCCNTRLTVA